MEQEVGKWEQKKIILTYKSVKMRIALCDTDNVLMKYIKSIIYRYAETKHLDIVADCYFYAEDILKSTERYNVVFLGYGISKLSCLEIAKKLRNGKNYIAIIFLSDSADFVFEAVKVAPYRILKKPINELDLFDALNDFYNDYGNSYPLWIKDRDTTVCLDAADILYLEADNKHCRVHLKNEILHANKTMARVYDVLPKSKFIKINRAFIVNSEHISRYTSENVFLKNGKALHMSRNYLRSFKKEYMEIFNPRQL